MKVTEVTVSVGTTFNNPYESYSNYRPSVTLKATVEEGEIAFSVAQALQFHAHQIVQMERERILAKLEEADRIERERREAEWKRQREERAKAGGETLDLDKEIPF